MTKARRDRRTDGRRSVIDRVEVVAIWRYGTGHRRADGTFAPGKTNDDSAAVACETYLDRPSGAPRIFFTESEVTEATVNALRARGRDPEVIEVRDQTFGDVLAPDIAKQVARSIKAALASHDIVVVGLYESWREASLLSALSPKDEGADRGKVRHGTSAFLGEVMAVELELLRDGVVTSPRIGAVCWGPHRFRIAERYLYHVDRDARYREIEWTWDPAIAKRVGPLDEESPEWWTKPVILPWHRWDADPKQSTVVPRIYETTAEVAGAGQRALLEFGRWVSRGLDPARTLLGHSSDGTQGADKTTDTLGLG
jgi:hypothetical protein